MELMHHESQVRFVAMRKDWAARGEVRKMTQWLCARTQELCSVPRGSGGWNSVRGNVHSSHLAQLIDEEEIRLGSCISMTGGEMYR